jgi:hypothetical protein
MNVNAACALCQRVTKRGTTAHHLIPRTCHANRWFKKNFSRERMMQTVDLCRDCHAEVHRLIPSEKLLGRQYNTLAALREHPKLARYLAWVAKQS